MSSPLAFSPNKLALLEKLLYQDGFRAGHADKITPRAHPNDPAPLSFAQQRLWFLQQFDPESHLYNIHLPIKIEGELHVAALEQSINEIVRRHEALRTTFRQTGKEPMQFVKPSFRVELVPIEVSGDNEVAEWIKKESRFIFDLSSGPLFHARLLRLNLNEHVLLLTMHHIVSDGWSMGVLLRELCAFYSADNKEQAALSDLPIQYADFAVWQRQGLQGALLASHLDYWKQQLAGIPAALELPTDRAHSASRSFRGAGIPFLISAELKERLGAFSQREGATLFMTLLAAFNVLLYRYTHQEDIVVGTPIAHRNHAEVEQLIGFFVNTLVMRTQCFGEFAFRELLHKVKEASLSAYAHQEVPFEKLVEELHPERSLSHSPLFQVMFDLQNAPMPPIHLENLRLTPLPFEPGTSKFDLTLTLNETANGLDGALEYSTDLFDETTVRQMVESFKTILHGMTLNPDAEIQSLPVLTEAEKRKLLIEWNKTSQPYASDALIHQLFERQAERTPERPALVCGDEALSYRALNARANQLARYLKKCGVGAEALVGILMQRSAETVVAILATLKAGGAYLPLDPSYPAERLRFMIKDARPRVVVTKSTLSHSLPESMPQIVCVDREADEIGKESAENLHVEASPANTAYAIYTSGSSGRPKGVIVSHQNLLHSTFARLLYYREAVRAFLLISPFSFDSSVAGLFWTLCQGGKLVVPEEADHQDPAYLLKICERHNVSHLLCLPSFYRVLLEQANDRLASLEAAIVAGEKCPLDLVRQHSIFLAGVPLFNEYGPTEATVWSSVYECCDDDSRDNLPIGRPIANTRIYLLDSQLHPVPPGVAGELHIGGGGVTRGYLNHPELTAERYIPDPFSGEQGARLYRTGDLARYLATGDLEFLGRKDFQVKLRGYRIELTEIESVLTEHASVQQTAVLMREDAQQNSQLVACIVLRPGMDVKANELREHLKSRLPAYMLPVRFVTLDSMPLTPAGKLNRKALELYGPVKPDTSSEYHAPQTALEEVLAGIFSEVLGVTRVGVFDNFFDLGGHSLLGTQVVSRVREIFQIELPLRRIFEEPTVSGLAQALLRDSSEQTRIQRMAELLMQFSGLSDEQAEKLLRQSAAFISGEQMP
ncbi:MAG TPA: amino acid adenylation domain-containing protein [Candidatus Angelobacter sp.]|nr:amino acid adenylation domain-containing protein [Candidatus Angelobacter sp.]